MEMILMTEKLITNQTFTNIDLAHNNLSYQGYVDCKFTNVNLTAAVLHFTRFTNCVFNNVNFTGAYMAGSVLVNSVFTNVLFNKSNLFQTIFLNTKLKHTSGSDTNLSEVQFINSSNDDVVFCNANMTKMVITNSSLKNSTIFGGDLEDLTINNSDLTSTKFKGSTGKLHWNTCKCKNTELIQCTLYDSQLVDCDGIQLIRCLTGEKNTIPKQPYLPDLLKVDSNGNSFDGYNFSEWKQLLENQLELMIGSKSTKSSRQKALRTTEMIYYLRAFLHWLDWDSTDKLDWLKKKTEKTLRGDQQ